MEKKRTQWNRIVQNSVPQNRMEYNGIEYNYFTSNTYISIIDHKCGNIPLTCHKHKVPLILFSIPNLSNKRVFVKCFACNVFVLTFLTVKDIAWYLFSDTCHCCWCCQDWGLHCSAVALCRFSAHPCLSAGRVRAAHLSDTQQLCSSAHAHTDDDLWPELNPLSARIKLRSAVFWLFVHSLARTCADEWRPQSTGHFRVRAGAARWLDERKRGRVFVSSGPLSVSGRCCDWTDEAATSYVT